jgi:RES domain-containing protein
VSVTAWRIVREGRAAEAFNGEGARQFGGRWNSPGRAVVYASASQSLAALEILVHLNPRGAMRFKAFRLRIDEAFIAYLPEAVLPANWQSEPPGSGTMVIGDEWVRAGRTAVLAVPSAIVPVELNYLLNPAHPDFRRITVADPIDFAFDSRLLA